MIGLKNKSRLGVAPAIPYFCVLAAGLMMAGCASPTADFPALRPGVVAETSALRIPSRHHFEIGPSASKPFSMQIQNRGRVPVRFATRDAQGDDGVSVTIAPGAFLNPSVPAGAVAVFRNATRMRTASLLVRVDAEASIPMRLQPLK